MQKRENEKTAVALWQLQMQKARQTPWFASLMLKKAKQQQEQLSTFFPWLANLPRHWQQLIRRSLAASLVGAALLLAWSPAPSVHAANITVTPGAAGINGSDGCSLVEAIINANANSATHAECISGSGADIITMANGTYAYTGTYGTDSALPDITSDITVEANGATIERDSGGGNFRLIKVTSSGSLTLNDATITGGNAIGGSGGGIYISSATTVTLNNSTVSGNSANDGGGIYNNSNGTITLNNSTVSNNSANNSGGGIFNLYATLELDNSRVSDNYAVTLGEGGGIYNWYGNVTLTNSTVSGNSTTSSTARGGGIYSNYGIVELTNSTVNRNSANDGGGIYASYATVTLTNSTVSGNSANDGGGIYVYGTDVTLNNSTVSGNSATNNGGGIYNYYSYLTLNRSVISGNNTTMGVGAEIYDYSGGYITANNYNVIGYGGSARSHNFTPTIAPVGTDIIPPGGLNTILLGLADNGGPTLTHALVSGSLAVDASPTGLATDQRGVTRAQDGDGDGTASYDVGAFELGAIGCGLPVNSPVSLSNLSLTITSFGTNLGCVRVTHFPFSHNNATVGIQTGQYWDIDGLQNDQSAPADTDFIFNLTLPHLLGANNANAKVCKYPGLLGGDGWDCKRTNSNASTVWRNGIMGGFSDWAVGDDVGPTAVSLNSFSAESTPTQVGLLAGITAVMLGLWQRLKRKEKQNKLNMTIGRLTHITDILWRLKLQKKVRPKNNKTRS